MIILGGATEVQVNNKNMAHFVLILVGKKINYGLLIFPSFSYYSTGPELFFFDSKKTPLKVLKPYDPQGSRVSKLEMEFLRNQKNLRGYSAVVYLLHDFNIFFLFMTFLNFTFFMNPSLKPKNYKMSS